MVPNGWKRVPIKEACESIIDCVNKTAPVVEFETPFKMIRTTNVRNGRVNTSDVRYVTEDTYLQWVRRGKPQVGDIIFTREAPVGEVGILENADGVFLGQRTMMYRANHNRSDNYYLFYSLLSSFCQKQIEDFSNGGTVAHMRVPDCGEILINLPPLPEQKKIAQILSTWDKAITTTEQLLGNSQQQKKALMQQLLTGKKRLLDKNGVRFSGEWKFQTISQISKRIQRKSDGEEHPILTISSLSGFVRQDERYSRYMAGESVKNYILLQKGEFAYNKGNSKTFEFGCIFDLENFKTGLVPHVYVCFKLNSGLSHRYFKYLFEADYLKPQLGALVNTGVRNNGLLNIKPSEFMATHVPVPCFDEQERIADVLQASSQTIHNIEQKLEALKQEKKALMQQLLTGKHRVKINEKEVA